MVASAIVPGVREIPFNKRTLEQAASFDKSQDRAPTLATSWREFENEIFEQGEPIAFGVERGEVALLVSLPNAGKTTLTINAVINLCLGKRFGAITQGGRARRVLYIDGETRRARFQRDIRRMSYQFDTHVKDQLRDQLQIVCEAEIDGESLSLTNPKHFLQVCAEAITVKPDLIVIDTMASLCTVYSENDNAEQQRKVWQPLQKLAREANSAILVIHHVGKRSEDSLTPERVYRGRGASASGAFCRAVWILTPDPVTPGLVTLACAKIKGETPADTRLQLNQETRWFSEIGPAPVQKTTLEIVCEAITKTMSLAEIKTALESYGFSDKTVRDTLNKAVANKLIEKVKQGFYGPRSAETVETANDLIAEPAEPAETDLACEFIDN